jgi:DNA-binding phage protein
MARPSSIDRLPETIREQIADLRRAGHTIDEIHAHLRKLDVQVGRSALGAHTKELDQLISEMHRSRAIAEAVCAPHDGAPPSRQSIASIEVLQAVIQKLISNDGQGLADLDPKEAMMAATAIEKLANARKKDLDYVRSIRAEIAADAAKAMENVAGEAGLSAEMIDRFKAKFLGIKS